jgi:hypothetical protein
LKQGAFWLGFKPKVARHGVHRIQHSKSPVVVRYGKDEVGVQTEDNTGLVVKKANSTAPLEA